MNYPESLLYEFSLVIIDRILIYRNFIIELFIVQLNSQETSWFMIDLEYLLYLESFILFRLFEIYIKNISFLNND